MAQQSKQRNFLSIALATASAATLMLGVSSKAWGEPDVLTPESTPTNFAEINFLVNNGPDTRAVDDGDSVLGIPDLKLNADISKTITFNRNGKTNIVLGVAADMLV